MKNKQAFNKHHVMLNLIQDLQRRLLSLRNSERGRSRIKYGMTPNFMGFTLIELLVVVLIIGILAAVALPQYQKAVVKSRLTQLKTLVTSISQAAETYYLANNTYPSSLEELSLDFPTPVSTQTSTGQYDAKFYSWGFCYLGTSVNANITCYDSRSQIAYVHFFNFISPTISTSGGDVWCTGITGSLAEKVCQQETKKTVPIYEGSIWSLTDVARSYLY